MARKLSEDSTQFVGWVGETCKGCDRAFMYYDKFGLINDEPTRKFYCPECLEKLGKKNKEKKLTPNEWLKQNNIKDKDVCIEFRKQVKKFTGKRLQYSNILKTAIEVVGYKKMGEK